MKNLYTVNGSTAIVHLKYRGVPYDCFIDTEDLRKVEQFTLKSWRTRIRDKDNTMYVLAEGVDGKIMYLHRLLINASEDMVVDHIDRNGLNNRKTNLRQVTIRDNIRASISCQNNSSGCPGVHWNRTTNKWRASIKIKGEKITLGEFKDLQLAIDARKRGEIRYWGYAT